MQSLADTVTAAGAMTPTEFVTKYCELGDSGTTQNQIAEQLALSVAANEATATDDQNAIKREAENETANALAFIAQVPACQEYPVS